MSLILPIILIIIILGLFVYLLYVLHTENKKQTKLQEELDNVFSHTEEQLRELTQSNTEIQIAWEKTKKEAVRTALDKSRSILRGQATEHLAPYMLEGINPKDCRFLGNFVDYIIFSGASDVTDGKSNQVDAILFVDVKTGQSGLSKVQRRIKDCIAEGRVAFISFNPDK